MQQFMHFGTFKKIVNIILISQIILSIISSNTQAAVIRRREIADTHNSTTATTYATTQNDPDIVASNGTALDSATYVTSTNTSKTETTKLNKVNNNNEVNNNLDGSLLLTAVQQKAEQQNAHKTTAEDVAFSVSNSNATKPVVATGASQVYSVNTGLEWRDEEDATKLAQQTSENSKQTTTEKILVEIEQLAVQNATALLGPAKDVEPDKAALDMAALHSNEDLSAKVIATALPLETTTIGYAATTHVDTLKETTTQVNSMQTVLPTAIAATIVKDMPIGNEESNEIRTLHTNLTAVKRAKFINDNSTNAQQMNLPDAAEVWSLAGMKSVPKINTGTVANQSHATTTYAEVTTTMPITNLSTNSDSHSEKNLHDWTQIMLHADMVGQQDKQNMLLLNNFEATTTSMPISNDNTHNVSTTTEQYMNTATVSQAQTLLTTILPNILVANTMSNPTADINTTTLANLSADNSDNTTFISTVSTQNTTTTPLPSDTTVWQTNTNAPQLHAQNTSERVENILEERSNVATFTLTTPTTKSTSTTAAVLQNATLDPLATPATLTTTTITTTTTTALPENHLNDTESDIIKTKSNLLNLATSTPATTTVSASLNEVNILKVHKKNKNEGVVVVVGMTKADEHDNVNSHDVSTLEHSLSETTTLSLLPASKVVTSAIEPHFKFDENLEILKPKDENTLEAAITTATTTTTALPSILATNHKTITTTTEINDQIGNEVDLDIKNNQEKTVSVGDSSDTKTTFDEVATVKTTTISSYQNELLIDTTKATNINIATTAATEKTTLKPESTTFLPSLPTIATIRPTLDTAESSTKVTPVRANNVDDEDTTVTTTSTATTTTTTAGAILQHNKTDLKETSIETNNVIDTFDKPLTTTPLTTTTAVQQSAVPNEKHEEAHLNSLEELDTKYKEHNEPKTKLYTETTTTMNNVPIVTATTTTTTTTIPTTVTPIINLLDVTTTTTTAATTSTAKLATTTPALIATKIEDIYTIVATTTAAPTTTTTNAPSTITTTTTEIPSVATTTPFSTKTATDYLPKFIEVTTTHIPTTSTASTSQPTTVTPSFSTITPTTVNNFKMLPTLDNDVVTISTLTTKRPDLNLAVGNINHSAPADASESDVNVIIAITVSVVGVIALILLVAFLYLMRKRQKQMSYGQRCRPVSLDAYSLDNVSVLGSVRRKGVALRASKRSFGNAAFDDPSLKHKVLSATELMKFVERRSSIFEEFRDVPQIIARADEVPHGCEDKNRYANVIPLPETRVILQQQHNDEKTEYINANYVRGPKDSPNYYIACQAPLEATVVDFWRMIWEQQSRVIIQATDLTENGIEKCAEYLPPSVTLDNHTTFGDFQVTLKNREVKEKYAISTIMLKNAIEDASRELTHYWYKWPETGVPNEEAPIIAMLLEARSSLKSYAIEQANELKEKSSTATLRSESNGNVTNSIEDSKDISHISGSSSGSNGEINGNITTDKFKVTTNKHQGPLTVHCSPGTGRTGTIIACDVAIRSLETPKRTVDIPQIVYYVRRGRASAVQTKEQYEFIYKVANMYATKITNLSNDN